VWFWVVKVWGVVGAGSSRPLTPHPTPHPTPQRTAARHICQHAVKQQPRRLRLPLILASRRPSRRCGLPVHDARQHLAVVISNHQAGGAHALGLVGEEVAALRVRIIGDDDACAWFMGVGGFRGLGVWLEVEVMG